MRYCVLCRSCESWIIIVLNYLWNCLILKCNPSLSMVRSYGVLRQSCSLRKSTFIALKRFLGIEMRTPNDLVHGETNRYPLFVNSAVRCIRYWLKLTRMKASRLPSKAYRMLQVLDERGQRILASNVRCKLYQYGFGFVWLNQGVEEMNQFLHVFCEKLIVCR